MAKLRLGNIDSVFSGSFSGSFAGDGTNLNLASNSTIPASNPFPFTGDAQITGSLIVSGALLVDFNDNDNIFISTPGSSSGDNNLTTGTHNLVIGMNAGENLTDSNNNVILGHEAASGSQFASAKSNNIVIGYRSGLNANPTNYGENIFIGSEAGRDSKGNRSVFIGGGSGTNAEGLYNTAIGYATMQGSHYATTPNYNTIIGYEAGKNLWDGDNNVAIGTQALAAGDSFKLLTNNIAIGPNSLDNAECIEYSIAIGTHALGSAHNNNYPASNPQGAGYNIAIGNYAGFSEDRGKQHIFIGEYAGYNVTNSTGSIIIGSGSRGETTLNHQLRIGNADVIAISGSLETGDVIFHNTASAPSFSGSFQGDGSGLTNLPSSFTAASISGSFTEASGGFSTRVTTLETSPAAGFPFAGDAVITGSLLISASNNTSSSLVVQGSGSTIFEVQGSQGQLFSITDDLIHSVLEVSDISGDTLFKVSGSGLITIPVGDLTGSGRATASYGAFKGDGSQLTNLPSTFTAAGISGSLGDNAALIRTLTATSISGSLGNNATLIRSLTAAGISGSFTETSASLSSRITDNATNLKAITSSLTTTGRMVFVGAGGTLTSEDGFTYNSTTNQLAVENLIVTHLTSSFVTASRVTTSGSNIFGDATSDTQTLIGTTKMSGSAQISGSLTFGGTAPLGLYSAGPKMAIDTSAVGGIRTKGALFIGHGADSTYTARILFGTDNSLMSFGRLKDSSAAIRGVTQNYAWQLFGIRHGLGSSTYTTNLPDTTFADNLTISGSGTYMSEPLKVHGSGSKVFEVIGTEGTLFSIDDDLDGTLFNVKDKTGIPIFEVSASSDVFIGNSPTSLYRTAQIASTTANVTQSIHSLSTSSYDGAFVEYTAVKGTNARAGNIMSVWDGSNVTFTETTTTDIGDTSDLLFQVALTQSVAQIQSYTTSAGYRLKTIIKAI